MKITDSLSKLKNVDWDYLGDQSDSPFANLHFYPGRFISQIPATLIGRLSKPGDTVLDPYCGSGTTLVESQRLGRHAIGIDINPTSILISRAKLIPIRHLRIRNLLRGRLNHFLDQRLTLGGKIPISPVETPSAVQLTKWYHPTTAAQLKEIWAYISSLRGISKELMEFAFSGILMQACSETRHWGYICDNTRPIEHRYIDAIDIFSNSVKKLELAYANRDADLPPSALFPLPRASVFLGDATTVMQNFTAHTVDLIITSPPYFGVIDYVKSQRLAMEWFGFNIETFRASETGARSKRHRIAAYSEYISELDGALREMARVLKPDGVLALLVGKSATREDPLPDLLEAARRAGLHLQDEFSREIAQGRRQASSLTNETLYLFSRS